MWRSPTLSSSSSQPPSQGNLQGRNRRNRRLMQWRSSSSGGNCAVEPQQEAEAENVAPASNAEQRRNTSSSRTSKRKERRRQYHLVAQEIESVIYGLDNDDDDDEHSENDNEEEGMREEGEEQREGSNEENHQLRRRRRLSLGSLRRRNHDNSMDDDSNQNTHHDSSASVVSSDAAQHRTRIALANNATTSSSLTTRRRCRRLRHRRPSSIAERAINSYTLFDEENKKRKQEQNQANKMIIYNKVYHPQSFFMNILIFLTVTFCLLIVLRILIALLTMAVGMMVLLLVGLRILQEFWTKPWKVLRKIHQAPILTCCALGAMYGLLVSKFWWITMAITQSSSPFLPGLSSQILTASPIGGEENISVDADVNELYDEVNDRVLSLHQWIGHQFWRRITTATYSTSILPSSSASSPSSPLQMWQETATILWSVGEGMIYGLEIGAIWTVFLGDASDPSTLGKWLSRQFRKAIPFYKMVQREVRQAGTLARRRSGIGACCCICLEAFYRHQEKSFLPNCGHGFHKDCLEHWTSIKPNCPICRITIVPLPATEEEQQRLSTNMDDLMHDTQRQDDDDDSESLYRSRVPDTNNANTGSGRRNEERMERDTADTSSTASMAPTAAASQTARGSGASF